MGGRRRANERKERRQMDERSVMEIENEMVEKFFRAPSFGDAIECIWTVS